MWGHSPLDVRPLKVALAYDIGEISAGCLVCYFGLFINNCGDGRIVQFIVSRYMLVTITDSEAAVEM